MNTEQQENEELSNEELSSEGSLLKEMVYCLKTTAQFGSAWQRLPAELRGRIDAAIAAGEKIMLQQLRTKKKVGGLHPEGIFEGVVTNIKHVSVSEGGPGLRFKVRTEHGYLWSFMAAKQYDNMQQGWTAAQMIKATLRDMGAKAKVQVRHEGPILGGTFYASAVLLGLTKEGG